MPITILATVRAKPQFFTNVEAALMAMVPTSRAEAGCSTYLLFRSEQQTGVFHLIETYADNVALNAHHQSPHFNELVNRLADKLIGDIQIEQVTEL